MSRQLILLNDCLRLHDNPLLNEPTAGDTAFAVIVLNKSQLVRASTRRQSLHAALLHDFAEQLAARKIPLHCYIADPWPQLQQLIQNWQIDTLVASTPCGIDEVRLLQKLATLCRVKQIDCNSLLADELSPDYAKFPKSCSQFRSQREPELMVSAVVDDNCHHAAFSGTGHMPTFIDPLVDQASNSLSTFSLFTSEGASKHWQNYLKSTAFSQYLQTRNQLFGDDYASFLSTALSFGTISVRQCWQDLQQGPQHPSAVWLKQELFWREYFRHYFRVYGDACFRADGLGRRQPLPKAENPSVSKENYLNWQQGKTGVPFIDANMRLLATTGLMSNRGRQNVASYLVFELGVDWRLGAEYFEQQLLDYDVASNWGNWAYIAGAGEGPARHFNIMKQAMQYDSNAEFVEFMLPDINSSLEKSAKHRPYATANNKVPWQESWLPYLP